MTATLSERMTETPRVFGRDELATSLAALPRQQQPIVVHVHGVAGIGKTTLLELIASRARDAGVSTALLPSGVIEPTDVSFLTALGAAAGIQIDNAPSLGDALAALPDPTLIIIDGLEHLRLLETWLRREFVPALPRHVRLVTASRYAPSPAWHQQRPGAQVFHSIELEPLDATAARELLVDAGVSPDQATRINGLVRGHPLALTLAAALLRDDPMTSVEQAATEGIVAGLSRSYLSDIPDRRTRRALEAASVTRRTTRPLLAAQLGADEGDRAFERLAALPIVRSYVDGLSLHESLKQAFSAELEAADPVRHRELRRAAWREFLRELRAAGDRDLWRFTSDILYLLQNPVLREGFFPSGPPTLSIEPALPADHEAIRGIWRLHDGPESVAILDAWLDHQPDGFNVVRDGHGEVIAFRCGVVSSDLAPALLEIDPIARAWMEELEQPSHGGLDGYFVRRWLTRDDGEGPSAAQGLCWIDCKRWYFRLRERLGSVFIAVRELEQYEAALAVIGFRRVPEAECQLDGQRYLSIVQDFGPGGVDGWYARLVGAELGLDPADLLDESTHELRLDGERIALTPLEFAVMRELAASRGNAVSHADLVERVWGYRYTGESNVDAVVVRGIRAKLGEQAGLVETVRGVGYRLNSD